MSKLIHSAVVAELQSQLNILMSPQAGMHLNDEYVTALVFEFDRLKPLTYAVLIGGDGSISLCTQTTQFQKCCLGNVASPDFFAVAARMVMCAVRDDVLPFLSPSCKPEVIVSLVIEKSVTLARSTVEPQRRSWALAMVIEALAQRKTVELLRGLPGRWHWFLCTLHAALLNKGADEYRASIVTQYAQSEPQRALYKQVNDEYQAAMCRNSAEPNSQLRAYPLLAHADWELLLTLGAYC